MLWEVTLHDLVRVTSQKTKILCYTSVKISNSSIILGRRQVAGVQTLLKVVIMCVPFIIIIIIIIIVSLKYSYSLLLTLLKTVQYFVTNMTMYCDIARSSYSTVPSSEMGCRPFILTEVFCGVLYFISCTRCHRPKRLRFRHCSIQYVQGMMF
jgi:hypothetical protein